MKIGEAPCTCTRYCDCPNCEPCACASMRQDPHCKWCCQHLISAKEKQWQEDAAKAIFFTHIREAIDTIRHWWKGDAR